MLKPRIISLLVLISLWLFAYGTVGQTLPQPSETSPKVERGIKLFQQGDFKNAVKVLREAVKKNKADAQAWHYLGLALSRQGNVNDAAQAYRAAVDLNPDFTDARLGLAYMLFLGNKLKEAASEASAVLKTDERNIHAHHIAGSVKLKQGEWLKAIESTDAALKLNDQFAPAYFLKSQAYLELYERASSILADEYRSASPLKKEALDQLRAEQPARLKEAADSLEQYLRLNPKGENLALWREQLEAIRVFSQPPDEANLAHSVFPPNQLTTKAIIKSKTEPSFTQAARMANVSGMVKLRLVLGADGQVKHIMVVRHLSHGLTEQAIKAARKIQFIPATKNSVPVSQFVTIEYNFNIY